ADLARREGDRGGVRRSLADDQLARLAGDQEPPVRREVEPRRAGHGRDLLVGEVGRQGPERRGRDGEDTEGDENKRKSERGAGETSGERHGRSLSDQV